MSVKKLLAWSYSAIAIRAEAKRLELEGKVVSVQRERALNTGVNDEVWTIREAEADAKSD